LRATVIFSCRPPKPRTPIVQFVFPPNLYSLLHGPCGNISHGSWRFLFFPPPPRSADSLFCPSPRFFEFLLLTRQSMFFFFLYFLFFFSPTPQVSPLLFRRAFYLRLVAFFFFSQPNRRHENVFPINFFPPFRPGFVPLCPFLVIFTLFPPLGPFFFAHPDLGIAAWTHRPLLLCFFFPPGTRQGLFFRVQPFVCRPVLVWGMCFCQILSGFLCGRPSLFFLSGWTRGGELTCGKCWIQNSTPSSFILTRPPFVGGFGFGPC